MQRPWGENVLKMFEEHQEGPSGRNQVREGAEVGGKVGEAVQALATRGF